MLLLLEKVERMGESTATAFWGSILWWQPSERTVECIIGKDSVWPETVLRHAGKVPASALKHNLTRLSSRVFEFVLFVQFVYNHINAQTHLICLMSLLYFIDCLQLFNLSSFYSLLHLTLF